MSEGALVVTEAVTPVQPPPPSRAVRFAKDFVAGTVAGWAQVLIGQPFDTVKVRLQSQPVGAGALYTGPLDATQKILKGEGLRGFYKGTLLPLIGVGGCVSIQFVASSQARLFLNGGKNKKLSIPEVCMWGFVMGSFMSFSLLNSSFFVCIFTLDIDGLALSISLSILDRYVWWFRWTVQFSAVGSG